jgi:hypothetical protein
MQVSVLHVIRVGRLLTKKLMLQGFVQFVLFKVNIFKIDGFHNDVVNKGSS